MLILKNNKNSPIIGVTPEQITHRTFVRHLLQAIEGSDVIQGINRRTQPSVQAEDLAVNQSSQGQEVEQVGEVLPYGGVAIFAEAFVVESVYLSDLSRLVVSTENCYSLAVSNLEIVRGFS